MPGSRPRLTLGEHLARRRAQLRPGLTQEQAADAVGVHRNAWKAWEQDAAKPRRRNHARIEEFCGWAPGSVAAVLDGRPPIPFRQGLASVTPLHGAVPPDDEVIRELRAMKLPTEYLDGLISAYWAEKEHDDTQRAARYRGLARRRADG